MSSKSASSCFTTFVLIVISLAVLRFLLPEIWTLLAVVFEGTLYAGSLLFVVALLVISYFTYKNLKGNQQRAEDKRFESVTRTETLYKSVISRLQADTVLNQLSAEELLQSEILITDQLGQIKKDLIRLKDFASSKNEKTLQQQIREYRQQIQQTTDQAVKEVIEENLKILNEKKERMQAAVEEIRQKEGSVDLLYNRLVNVEEDLKFGRPVSRLFPPEVYSRFGMSPPADQERLPPLTEKSSN